jgi:hypothetical protein
MLSAYYFRAQMYTCVPHQIREDLSWMADHGTDAVIVGVLEQDLFAARENLDTLCAEAERAGLRVLVTPSRWGSLVAGCPKVPSILCATQRGCWSLQADGEPCTGFLGPIASVHHPATIDYFATAITDLLGSWPISGIVWDELKNLGRIDHSPAAKAAMGSDWSEDLALHQAATVAFFGRLNRHAKAIRLDCLTSLFVYGSMQGPILDRLAATPALDEFGCDGRPWAAADIGSDDSGSSASKKFLIDAGPRFIAAARGADRGSLALIENLAMAASDNEKMQRRLPEIREQGWEHLIYYYYPRSCETPELSMDILGRALADWRAAPAR